MISGWDGAREKRPPARESGPRLTREGAKMKRGEGIGGLGHAGLLRDHALRSKGGHGEIPKEVVLKVSPVPGEAAGQFEVGVAFMARNNPLCLAAHVEDLGMMEAGESDRNGKNYVILAFGV